MNKATKNIYVCADFSVDMFSTYLSKYQQVPLLGHMVTECIILQESTKLSSKMIIPFLIL